MDRFRLLLQHFLAGTQPLVVRWDHRWDPLVDALALRLGLFQRVVRARLVFIHARQSGKGRAGALLDDATGGACLGDERQARADPGRDAALEILGPIAAGPQASRRTVAPRTATADRDHDAVPRDLGETSPELAERDVLSSVDVARVPLVLLAHVQEVKLGTPLADVLGKHGSILAHGGEERGSQSDEGAPGA